MFESLQGGEKLPADVVGKDDGGKTELLDLIEKARPIGVACDYEAHPGPVIDQRSGILGNNRFGTETFGLQDGRADPGKASFINYQYFFSPYAHDKFIKSNFDSQRATRHAFLQL